MNLPLFLFPFDHRASFARDILSVPFPFSPQDLVAARGLKELLFAAFLAAVPVAPTKGTLGVLVDELTGSTVIAAARERGVPYAVALERSGDGPFALEHGADFRAQLATLAPGSAKALLRWNPHDAAAMARARTLLYAVGHACQERSIDLLLELTFPEPLAHDATTICAALTMLRGGGVHPTVWKLPAPAQPAQWERVRAAAHAPIILLGGGAPLPMVLRQITHAAASGVVDGFAVGRTLFTQPLQEYVAGRITRSAAQNEIAEGFRACCAAWGTSSTL